MSLPTGSQLSNRRRRLLAAMGIDVWVLRPAGRAAAPGAMVAADTASDPGPATGPQVRLARPATVAAAAPVATRGAAAADGVAAAAESAAVSLTALAGDGAVVVGEAADNAGRKLLAGVFIATAAWGAKPQLTRFVWPQLGHDDPSPAALQTAYRAFLKGQTSRAGASVVILMGAAAAAPLAGEAVDNVQTLRCPAPAELCRDPDAKRALWLQIAALPRT